MLLVALFLVMWRLGAMAVPVLDNIRFVGGLHPADVLMLMQVLKIMWIPAVIAAVLYVLSFLFARLNTAAAVAKAALSATVILSFVLMLALVRISL